MEDRWRKMGWFPMSEYREGEHVLFFFEHGERGNGGMETAMAFWNGSDNTWDFWTHGGPNSGSDIMFTNHAHEHKSETPTHWMPLPKCPAWNPDV